MNKERVVVTGLGCVSPVGNDVTSMWQSVKAGLCGVTRISLFDASSLQSQVAAEVKNFTLDNYDVDHKIARKLSRFQKFFLASAIEAVEDSGLKEEIKGSRSAVIGGVGIGLSDTVEEGYEKMLTTPYGESHLSPLLPAQNLNNEAVSIVSIHYGIQGPSWALSTACASGSDALGVAKLLIEAGIVDVAVAGGVDANINKFVVGTYSSLQALASNYNDNPLAASRPFDKDRCGFVIGEGAAALVLESEQHALKRGAKIYAKFLGYGVSSDAHHITSPLKDGSGAALALNMAIKDASLTPEQIGYYNAHGTSTIANDWGETNMLHSVFGEYARKLHISSTKGVTGHLIGAAGALEAIITIKAMNEGFIPPTINLDCPDIERGCDLDYTAKKGIAATIENAASASLGFGGHNAAVVFSKYR